MLSEADIYALEDFAASEPTGAQVVDWLARRGLMLNAEVLVIEARLAGAGGQFEAKSALVRAAEHMAH